MKKILILMVLCVAGLSAAGRGLDAPNLVEISPTLVTAGQPTAKALAGLGQLGFEAVIYLAPGTVPDAVSNEAEILRAQGIEFVHLPIPFNAPSEAHFMAVSSALQRLAGKKVLVHCQVNRRASAMVFLHRAITLREEPLAAYAFVSRVWSPEGPWRALVVDLLKKNQVPFRPL
jgi:protein tyrosine phosphatase (PTP) superfamily phosphohydrolase (DUF442 family)